MDSGWHNDLVRQSSTADVLGRYYTSSHISDVLVDAVSGLRPKVVVELGSGQGAITRAASRKWGAARFITVDADQSTIPPLDGLPSRRSHTHHIHDALDDALADRIGVKLGSVDIGLCNPPYVRPRWRNSYGRILEDAGLSGALKSVHDAGADLLFIAQNLRLLKRNGKLGLLLPDGLITGEKYRGVRAVLLREHVIEQVIQLPRGVFSRTEAQTYLVVVQKMAGATQAVELKALKSDGTLSSAIQVPADIASSRLDFSFHSVSQHRRSAKRSNGPRATIGSMAEALIRGTPNSSQIADIGFPVFHLSDFPNHKKGQIQLVAPARFRLSKRDFIKASLSLKIAQQGDILIARVGRNLHEKLCVVPRGSCVISDCIYALRCTPEYREAIYSFLSSVDGKRALDAAAHGVGAQYLSRSDLLDIVVPSRWLSNQSKSPRKI